MLRYLLIAALSIVAYAQLPDAPSSRQCWVVDENAKLQPIPCEQVPYASPSNNWSVIEAPPYHTPFLKARRWTDPPLRTNHEIFHSKSFIALNIALWGATGANLARNWNNYRQAQPHGGELLVDALVPAAVVSASTWLSYKYLWVPIGVGAATYGIIFNAKSAADHVYH